MLVALAVAPVLAGCSGDSGGGGGGGPALPAPTLAGLWQGSYTGLGLTNATEAVAFVLQDDRLLMVDDLNVVYDGPYSLFGSNEFTALPIRRFNAGGAEINGTLRIGGRLRFDTQFDDFIIDATINLAAGGTNNPDNIQLRVNDDYQQSSSLSRVSGTWLYTANSSTLTLTINGSSGIITGQVGACFYTGSLATPNPQRNLYNVTLSSSVNCPISFATFTGFAMLSANDTALRILVAGNNGALHFPMQRP